MSTLTTGGCDNVITIGLIHIPTTDTVAQFKPGDVRSVSYAFLLLVYPQPRPRAFGR